MDAQALVDLAREGAPLERQRDALAGFLREAGVSDAGVDALLARTRDGIALLPGKGRSRLGGDPLLPRGESWPHTPDGRHLSFIAAIDLDELPDLEPLPPGGLLLVYWDFEFHDLERMDFLAATRVFGVPAADAVEAETPVGAVEFGPLGLEGLLMPLFGELDEVEAPADDGDAIYDAVDALDEVRHHQLLGSSNDVQGPVLQEVDYWFGEGFPETRERYDEAELRGEGWILLAQFDSEGDDLMFGDAGALYLVMPEADLRAGRFDRVMGIMQSA